MGIQSIVYIGDLTFQICARAVHHVIIEHTRELPLEQKLNLHQVGDPTKIQNTKIVWVAS